MALCRRATLLFGMLAFGLPACNTGLEAPEHITRTSQERLRDQYGTVHGRDGFVLFSTRRGGGAADGAVAGAGAIGVNPFLWRAALETIDFMPLASTDPFGGVIITDWYSPPETPGERFKINVFILDTALRADGVRVSVFRQTRGEDGWTDATVERRTATSIEDSILTRARELRIGEVSTAGQ
jgi:hypothetical protein